MVQEAFTRLYSSFTSVRDPERAAGYLRITVLNLSRQRRTSFLAGRLRRRTRCHPTYRSTFEPTYPSRYQVLDAATTEARPSSKPMVC